MTDSDSTERCRFCNCLYLKTKIEVHEELCSAKPADTVTLPRNALIPIENRGQPRCPKKTMSLRMKARGRTKTRDPATKRPKSDGVFGNSRVVN
ncbi:MAG: hypothetical protein ACLQEQ_04575 [Nitrososphaerales archaeon]